MPARARSIFSIVIVSPTDFRGNVYWPFALFIALPDVWDTPDKSLFYGSIMIPPHPLIRSRLTGSLRKRCSSPYPLAMWRWSWDNRAIQQVTISPPSGLRKTVNANGSMP